MKDWEWIAEMWCYGLWGFGVRPADTLFVAFGYATFIGFWGLHYAGEKMGCLVLPGGAMTTDMRAKTIVEMGATVVASTPTYALRLAQVAAVLGVDLPGSAVSRLILSGEPAGSIPQTKALIEEQWGAKAYETAGMTEIGTIMVFECAEQPGGTHIIEDHYIEEVLDPISGVPVGYGQMGERVVTSFGRGFIPVLRYRTRDLVVRIPGSTCPCGRTFDIYEGGIRGRVDDMKLVRGTNVYPRAVEAIVREHAEIDEFQIHLYTEEGIRDEIEVLVEIPDPAVDASALLAAIGKELAGAHEGLRFGTCAQIELGGVTVLASRISYVGELGWELHAPFEQGARVWDTIWDAGQQRGLVPVGIGVYGTTGRLENGYTLVEAGMARPSVKQQDFIGRAAYLGQRAAGPCAVLCTLTVDDHRSAAGPLRYMMGGEPILTAAGEPLADAKGRPSYVTSAGSGPSVGKHLLMAYLPADQAVQGAPLAVEYLGEQYPVTVAVAGAMPLFDPENERVRR